MDYMFYVRSAACLCTARPTPPATQDLFFSPLTSHRASPCLAVCTQIQPATCLERLKRDQHGQNVPGAQRHLPLHRAQSHCHRVTIYNTQDPSRLPFPTAHRLAWQSARAFNLPLAWDVSSVTSMYAMFSVRSAACFRATCLTPTATQDPSRLTRATPQRRTIHLAFPSHNPPCPSVCIRIQPAARLGRLERDQHVLDVCCAQRHVALVPRHLPYATRHARSISPPTSHRASPRLAVCTSFQSAARLGRL